MGLLTKGTGSPTTTSNLTQREGSIWSIWVCLVYLGLFGLSGIYARRAARTQNGGPPVFRFCEVFRFLGFLGFRRGGRIFSREGQRIFMQNNPQRFLARTSGRRGGE